jgi:hypothetical protein
MTVPVAGGSRTSLASGQPTGGIAIDGTNVFWTDRGGIMKVPVRGGTATTVASPALSGVAVDETSVYWTAGITVTMGGTPATVGGVMETAK